MSEQKKAASPQTRRCGIVMPISAMDGYPASHWEGVLAIIREALGDTDFQVELVSNADDVGVIHKRIVQNLYDNEIIICDVSGKNPNVMFELGMRLAFDKPAIIIKDTVTSYNFDTGPIEHISYPRDLNYHAIKAFKSSLLSKLTATCESAKAPGYTTFLKHFGQFVSVQLDHKPGNAETYLLDAVKGLQDDLGRMYRTISRPMQTPIEVFQVPTQIDFDDMKSIENLVDIFISTEADEIDWTAVIHQDGAYVDALARKFINRYLISRSTPLRMSKLKSVMVHGLQSYYERNVRNKK